MKKKTKKTIIVIGASVLLALGGVALMVYAWQYIVPGTSTTIYCLGDVCRGEVETYNRKFISPEACEAAGGHPEFIGEGILTFTGVCYKGSVR